MTRVAVTGSVAFDTIMVFPGRFGDHILPDKTHLINVSFLIDRLDRRRGGTAANIAYTMALLGERPLLAAAVGNDFEAYGRALAAEGVDLGAVLTCEDIATAAAYITTDLDDNQITAFHPGAMGRASAIDLRTIGADVEHVVISPDAPDAMAAHVVQAAEMGAKLVFAPAQQLPSMADETLIAGLDAAWLIVGNDYELELIRSRTGRDAEALAASGATVAQTLGGEGSRILSGGDTVEVPVARAAQVVDPTGAGDAYIAGLLAGLRGGAPLRVAGRMGALAATYVVERTGTQSHHFTRKEYATRYLGAFDEELAQRLVI
jgi:adenosine kinase